LYPTLFSSPGVKAFAETIDAERQAQLAKWGDQRHPDGTGGPMAQQCADITRAGCQQAAEDGSLTWKHILAEEVWEALAETDPGRLRAELVQVAAVCAAWIHDLDRRPSEAAE